jgi:signal transduction histidine kinase
MDSVNALIIEDSEDDAVLLISAIRSGGSAAKVKRIETAAELTATLENDPVDVIISDYQLPGFDARQALEMVKRTGKDIPFIVVSGSVPENIIVETVKAGARDYLMKPNLTRLPFAIEREVAEAAERRHARKLEEQLRHAQRLESLGVLAGGVAHDFNNILTGILGNASLATEILPPDNQALPLIEAVVSAAEHAASLTRQLLAYAGKGQFYVQPLDLTQVVRSCANLLRLSVSKNVQLDFDLRERLPLVSADRGQAEQILMNLVINGAEAIGVQRPGRVVIRTDVQSVRNGEQNGVDGEPLTGGEYVRLEVTDNGPGIPRDVEARMFDPFFTTKFTGRGLGLSAVAGIVRAHRGAIRVQTAEGRGTVFEVLFAPTKDAARTPSVNGQVLAQMSGTVLLIDDDELVRKAAQAVLQQHGLSVVAAPDGGEGVELFRRMADRVGVIVVDLTMPVVSGEGTLDVLRRIKPSVPIIVCSGYTEQDARETLQTPQDVHFLQKPYGSIELARAVQQAMNGAVRG